MQSRQTSPPNTTPEDVPAYFIRKKFKRKWRETEFQQQHPDRDYEYELEKLAKRKIDGNQDPLKKVIEHARRIKLSNKNANVVNNTIYNPINPILSANSVKIINNLKENIPTRRKRSDELDTDDTDGEDLTDSEDDHVSVTHQDTPSAISQDFDSPGPDSDTLLQPNLPSYIFLDDPQASNLDADKLKILREKFPKLPEASPYFYDALEACKPLIDDRKLWPSRPKLRAAEDELEQHNIWHYVFNAIYYFVMNYDTVRMRAPTHGEGWADVNVWASLWDHAFMKSRTLSIDRKDLSPIIYPAVRHDGILRSAKTSCNRCLGFIEVKPDRNTNQNTKGVLADRLKVIQTIVATLKTHNTPNIIIGGIICNGMTFNILRGADLGNGQYVFKESSFDVSPENIVSVVLCCWRMKLALEASYSAIVTKLPQNVFE